MGMSKIHHHIQIKTVPEFPMYSVYSDGKVFCNHTKAFMEGWVNSEGVRMFEMYNCMRLSYISIDELLKVFLV